MTLRSPKLFLSMGLRFVRVAGPLLGLGLALAGCSGSGNGNIEDQVRSAGPDRKIRLRLESGPLGELVVSRDTQGRLVVSGLCFFPDGTRLTVAVYDSLGRNRARTQPVVEGALFRSLPLGDGSGAGWPTERYRVEVSATFAPGSQPPDVLEEMRRGQFQGEGMTQTLQGHLAYSRHFQVSP